MSIIRNSLNCTCSWRFRGAPWLDQLSRWRWMQRHCGSCGRDRHGHCVLGAGHGSTAAPRQSPQGGGGGAHLAQFQLFNERGPLVFHLLPIRRPFGFDLKSERQRSAEFLEMKHLGTATDRVALHLHSAGGDLHLRKELSGPVNRESFSLF